MTKVIVSEDCTEPKKAFLRDFNIAFAEANAEHLLKSVTDDIEWDLLGDSAITGKEAFATSLTDMLSEKAEELVIKNIITQDEAGTIHGTMSFADGTVVAFCDVCTFDGDSEHLKIKQMTSYGVELSEAR